MTATLPTACGGHPPLSLFLIFPGMCAYTSHTLGVRPSLSHAPSTCVQHRRASPSQHSSPRCFQLKLLASALADAVTLQCTRQQADASLDSQGQTQITGAGWTLVGSMMHDSQSLWVKSLPPSWQCALACLTGRPSQHAQQRCYTEVLQALVSQACIHEMTDHSSRCS